MASFVGRQRLVSGLTVGLVFSALLLILAVFAPARPSSGALWVEKTPPILSLVPNAPGSSDPAPEVSLAATPVVGLSRWVTTRATFVTTARETLEATPAHPFFVQGRGWVPASRLQRGDRLATATGESVEVADVESRAVPARTVYNLLVRDRANYRVGHQGVLVHNGGCFGKPRVVRDSYLVTAHGSMRPLDRNGPSGPRPLETFTVPEKTTVVLYTPEGAVLNTRTGMRMQAALLEAPDSPTRAMGRIANDLYFFNREELESIQNIIFGLRTARYPPRSNPHFDMNEAIEPRLYGAGSQAPNLALGPSGSRDAFRSQLRNVTTGAVVQALRREQRLEDVVKGLPEGPADGEKERILHVISCATGRGYRCSDLGVMDRQAFEQRGYTLEPLKRPDRRRSSPAPDP